MSADDGRPAARTPRGKDRIVENQTCYIPYFTRELGRYRETACQRWVMPSEHTNDPTCPGCREYVEQEARDDARTAEDVFGSDADVRHYGPAVRPIGGGR